MRDFQRTFPLALVFAVLRSDPLILATRFASPIEGTEGLSWCGTWEGTAKRWGRGRTRLKELNCGDQEQAHTFPWESLFQPRAMVIIWDHPPQGAVQLSIPLPPFITSLQRGEEPSAALSYLASGRDRVWERCLSTSDLLVAQLTPCPLLRASLEVGAHANPQFGRTGAKLQNPAPRDRVPTCSHLCPAGGQALFRAGLNPMQRRSFPLVEPSQELEQKLEGWTSFNKWKKNQTQKGGSHQCSGTGEDVAGQQIGMKKPIFRAQLAQHGTSCGVGCQQISRADAKYLLIWRAPIPHARHREGCCGKTQSMTRLFVWRAIKRVEDCGSISWLVECMYEYFKGFCALLAIDTESV